MILFLMLRLFFKQIYIDILTYFILRPNVPKDILRTSHRNVVKNSLFLVYTLVHKVHEMVKVEDNPMYYYLLLGNQDFRTKSINSMIFALTRLVPCNHYP